ncbi:MAG TPA: glycosyltransferase family 4 protein [Terriglobia bacterium]|nr:glycosyltransferase family 4 protein [Terriglobia bacterium]
MRITILAQYFPPETTATGRRAEDLAEVLAERGHEVTVITGRPNHPSTVGRLLCRDVPDRERAPKGYQVVRVPVFRSSDGRALKRLLNYATFMLAAAWAGMKLPRPDAIIAVSPLPTGFAALLIHWRHHSPLVFDLQDIWPDSARAVGVMDEGLTIRILRSLERLLYRCSARVVVISEGFRRYLVELGVPAERVVVIHNGVDTRRFGPMRAETRIRKARPLRGRFVVGYIGNLGLAQGLDTVLEAARSLSGEPAAFLLIGEGVDKPRLQAAARAARLSNVRFLHGVPRRRAPSLLAACDALLVILRDDPLFQITIPSKLYEYMAAGKPILCSVGGEAAALVADAGCGITLRPADPTALAQGVLRLMADPREARAFGEAGARWVREHFDRCGLMDAYAGLVESLDHRVPARAVRRRAFSPEIAAFARAGLSAPPHRRPQNESSESA